VKIHFRGIFLLIPKHFFSPESSESEEVKGLSRLIRFISEKLTAYYIELHSFHYNNFIYTAVFSSFDLKENEPN